MKRLWLGIYNCLEISGTESVNSILSCKCLKFQENILCFYCSLYRQLCEFCCIVCMLGGFLLNQRYVILAVLITLTFSQKCTSVEPKNVKNNNYWRNGKTTKLICFKLWIINFFGLCVTWKHHAGSLNGNSWFKTKQDIKT